MNAAMNIHVQVFFFFLVGLGFELRTLHLQSRHSTATFAPVILEMGVSRTISWGWPQTATFWISASQVARITDVNHWRLVCTYVFISLGCIPRSGKHMVVLYLIIAGSAKLFSKWLHHSTSPPSSQCWLRFLHTLILLLLFVFFI
jgi:hypothetical protein